jgi:hypothetical protein
VTHDFLGNKKAENYEEIIKELITHYCKMGHPTLKIHFLHSHLNFFPQNFGAVSDEQERDFTRIYLLTMEKRYQGRWDPGMMGDYCWCWCLIRENKTPYKRISTFARKVIDGGFMLE